jgi:hypothetical protein
MKLVFGILALVLIGCFGDESSDKKDPEEVQAEAYDSEFKQQFSLTIQEEFNKITFKSSKEICTDAGEVSSEEVLDVQYYAIADGVLSLWRGGECMARELVGGSDLTSTWTYTGDKIEIPAGASGSCYGPFDKELQNLAGQKLKISSKSATLTLDAEDYCPAQEIADGATDMDFTVINCKRLTLDVEGFEAEMEILSANKQTGSIPAIFKYGEGQCISDQPDSQEVDAALCKVLKGEYTASARITEFDRCAQELGYPSIFGS